jgi:hypothetical protein
LPRPVAVPRFCTAPVLDADVDAEVPWVATEFIHGPTLDVVLLERGQLRGSALESFAVGVAVALRAIHQNGVVHRDLKPSNVLLSPLGPRVIDFGNARVEDAHTQLTQAHDVVGTPAFMAPEQLRGGPVTSAIDVFAWATVVTHAATGQLPFGSGEGVMHAIAFEPPNLGDLEEPLRSLVIAAFHKDPAARPSASDLVDRLWASAPTVATRILASATAAVPPTGAPSAGAPPADGPARPRHRRPRRLLLAGAGTAFGVLAVAVTVSLWLATDRSPAGTGPPNKPDSANRAVEDAGPTTGDASASPSGLGSLIWAPLTGHTDTIRSVALGQLDGKPIAVSGAADQTIRIWDLTTGRQIGDPIAAHNGAVHSVAIGELDGVSVAVSSSSVDGTGMGPGRQGAGRKPVHRSGKDRQSGCRGRVRRNPRRRVPERRSGAVGVGPGHRHAGRRSAHR